MRADFPALIPSLSRRFRPALLPALFLLGRVGVGQAATMSAGALFGSPTQTTAVCYLYTHTKGH